MAISFKVTVKNAPPGTAFWTAIWYDEVRQWETGWLTPPEAGTFTGVPEVGWFYCEAYDAAYNLLTDPSTWGQFALAPGSYVADFATRTLRLAAPPPAGFKIPSWAYWAAGAFVGLMVLGQVRRKAI